MENNELDRYWLSVGKKVAIRVDSDWITLGECGPFFLKFSVKSRTFLTEKERVCLAGSEADGFSWRLSNNFNGVSLRARVFGFLAMVVIPVLDLLHTSC